MPFNKTGGKKSRRNKNLNRSSNEPRYANNNDGEYYGKVENPLGSCQFEIKKLPSGEIVKARLAGSLRKVWVRKDDYVLISTRECDTRKNAFMDIIHKFHENEVSNLKQQNLLSVISSNNNEENEDIQIHFNTIDGDNKDENHDVRLINDHDINNI